MRAIRTAAALLVPLAMVACGEQGGDQPAMDQEQAPADRQAMQDTARGQGGAAMNVALSSKNDSGITGTARILPRGDSLAVKVSLSGLTQGDSYAAHLHNGTCQSGGGVAVGLNPVTGLADGTGTSTKRVAMASLASGQGYFIQAHLPDGTPAACGDLAGAGSASAESGSDM